MKWWTTIDGSDRLGADSLVALWRRCCLGALLGIALGVGAAAQSAAPDAELAAQREQASWLADSDTLLALASDGLVLYAQDKVKLTGYQYCSQAVALAEAGEFRQSVRAASKALHLANTTNDPNLQAVANRDLAIVYSYAGQLDKAEEFAREALRYPAKDPKQVIGPMHKVLGDVQARRGDHPGAVKSYDTALLNSSTRYAPLVQASLVNALIQSGDAVRARTLFDDLDKPADASLAAQLERTQARLLLAEKRPAEAREFFLRSTVQRAGVDTSYYHMWAWDGVARSDLALNDKPAAALAMGHALNSIDVVRARFRSEEFKMGLFSDLQAVFDRGVGLYIDTQKPREAFETSERSRARALLDAVRGRADVSTQELSSTDLASLQRTLKPDERVVQFHSLPERLLVWVISPSNIQAQSIAIGRDELTELVEGFRNSIVRGRSNAIVNAEKMGAGLLGKMGLTAGERLIFVPHGPLHYLPFQALRLNGRYLIETHPVSVAPSASIAVQLAQRNPRVLPQLTAFGNPRIADQYDLPGAEGEVKQLAKLFPRTQLFVGTQATKTQFRDAVTRTPLVHVAAHAEADLVDPLYSRILLANENGQQSFLEAKEISGLSMDKAALVTLSACDSGLGRVAKGDEVLGFPRSFLAAGTSSLIVSLWPVADDATEVLMGTLYAKLARGEDVQRAMQAGQLAVLNTPALAHPFFWAPFNLVGNWRLTVGGDV